MDTTSYQSGRYPPAASAAPRVLTPCVPRLNEVTIRPGTPDDISPIMDLHIEAFADKFGGAFGVQHIARGAAAMADAWRHQGATALQGMFVAEWQEQVIGTTMLRTREMNSDFFGTTERSFQQALGVWGATRSLFALSLLSHDIGRQEGFITDVAVLAPYRRRGVAQALLAYAEQRANQMGKHYLGLYVSSANHGAYVLYQHLGFRTRSVRRSWLTRLIFGHREWFYMRKTLR